MYNTNYVMKKKLLFVVSASILLVFCLWYLRYIRNRARMREEVRNILYEYIPSDDTYNYVEMEDRSSNVKKQLLDRRPMDFPL